MRHFFCGHWYTIEASGDGWMVQRDGSDEFYGVKTFPPYCTCADYIFRRDGNWPTPCKHIRATRECLKATNGTAKTGTQPH